MADPRYFGINLKQAIEILGLQPSQRNQAHLSKLAYFLRNQDGFFSALSHLDTEIISKWLGYEYVYPAQPVFKKGDFGESMYIVIGGACEYVGPNDAASGQHKAPEQLLTVGQCFGETALVAPRRTRSRTVVASSATGGAHLVTINRSALSSLRFMGAAQADASQALQAILAACCLGGLRQPPGSRSTGDVEMLSELMSNMEAFKKLPSDMIRRLAADCAHVRVPAGRVLFEEDAPGNCMYVVVSGQCQVRARPLALRSKSVAGSGRALLRPGSLGIGMTMTPRKMHTSGFRSLVDSTPRSIVSFGSSSMAGAATEVSGPGGATGGGDSGGMESDAVRSHSNVNVPTGLRGEGQLEVGDGSGGSGGEVGCDDDESDDDEHHPRVSGPVVLPAAAASRVSSGSSANTTGKDSPFWIARFMEDTLKRLRRSDSSAGLGQQMTPLAAVAAARWRQAASGRHGGGTPVARGGGIGNGDDPPVVVVQAEGEEEGMEALLGRAAARALRQAVSEQRSRKGHNYGMEMDGEPHMNPSGSKPGGGGSAGDSSVASSRPVTPAMGKAATVTTILTPPLPLVVPPLTPPRQSNDSRSSSDDGGGRGRSSSSDGAAADPADTPAAAAAAESAPTPSPSPPPAAPTQAVAVEDPAKRLLSKLGNRDPANVSRTLLAELVQRADVGVVLYEVAKRLVKRGGGPRRINQSTSKKINRVLHHQIRSGPENLQGTLQGQKVLGRHSTVAAARTSSLSTKGIATAVLVSGHHHQLHHSQQQQQQQQQRPVSRHGAGAGAGAVASTLTPAGIGAAGREHMAAAATSTPTTIMPSSVWGESTSVQGSQNPRSSNNFAPGTRPGSALTSGVSGYVDFDGDLPDDLSDFEWNSSDLYSMASYKPSGGPSHVNGVRRMTAGDLDMNNLINTENLSPGALDSMYGTVIRRITPGQSFGELALLHRDSRRTATIITGCLHSNPPASPHRSPVDQPVDLLCITRHTYNHTVRAAQVAQLQGLLSFLARVSPFRGLDDQQRTSLAVFCRQREVAAGAVLAVQGEPADTLWMILEGEVVLLDGASSVVEPLMARPGATRPPARRAGSIPIFGLDDADGDGGASGGNAGGGNGSGSRSLTRQLSAPEGGGPGRAQSLRPAASTTRKEASSGRRVMFVSGTANHGAGGGSGNGSGSIGSVPSGTATSLAADGHPRYVSPATLLTLGRVLTAMGPGGIFGEGLLMAAGTTPQMQQQAAPPPPPPQPPLPLPLQLQYQQQPQVQGPSPLQLLIMQHGQQQQLQALQLQQQFASQAAQQPASTGEDDEIIPRGRKGRGRGSTPAVPPPYPFTVIARRATRLLTISANDLSRFSDVVAAPLAELAASRAEFLAGRVASVSAAKEAVSERISNGRRVLRVLRIAQDYETYPGLEEDLRLAAAESAAEAAAAAADAAAAAEATPPLPAASASSFNGSRTLAGGSSTNASTSVLGSQGSTSQGVSPAPGRTVMIDGGVMRLTGATNSLRELAARYIEGSGDHIGDIYSSTGINSSIRSLSGRKSAQLLPAALLRRLQSRNIGNATAAATAAAAAIEEALRSTYGVSTLPMQPHPAGERLEALLYNSTPQLPGTSPSWDEQSGRSLPPTSPPIEYSGWGLADVDASGAGGLGAGGGMRCLSTITEESSGVLLRTTVSNLDRAAVSVGDVAAAATGAQGVGGDSSGRRTKEHEALGTRPQDGDDAYTEPWVTGEPWITADPRVLGITDVVANASRVMGSSSCVGNDPQLPQHMPCSSGGGGLSTYRTTTSAGGSCRTTTSAGGSCLTGEAEYEEEEVQGVLSAVDPYFDSLGTVEEGDEEAALAERSDELTPSTGRRRELASPASAAAAAPPLGAVASTVVDVGVGLPLQGSRPQLPPLRLSGLVLSPVNSSRPPSYEISTPLLPPLRLPPAAPGSHRRRPHSSSGMPAADAASTQVADDILPPLLSRRRASLTPTAQTVIQHLRTSGSQPTVSSSTVQSYYTDISLAASTGIPAAVSRAAAAAAVAAATATSYWRPHSADGAAANAAASGGSSFRGQRHGGSFGSDGLSASESLLIYTDEGSISPDLTHVRFESGASTRGGSLAGPGSSREDPSRALAAGPFVRPLPRSPATSNLSEGLVPLSGFTSSASSALATAVASPPQMVMAAQGSEPGTGTETGSRSRYESGSAPSGSESETVRSGHVIMEAQRAPMNGLVTPWKVRQSLWRPTIFGSDGVVAGSGSGSGRSSISSVVRMPEPQAGPETEGDMYAVEAALAVAAALRVATGSVTSGDEEPSALYDKAPPPAATAVNTAAAAVPPSYTDVPKSDAASLPVLPWSNVDSRIPSQLPPPPLASSQASLNQETSAPQPQPPWSPPVGEPTAAEMAMLSDLPPRTLVALRRRLAGGDEDDVLGSGPQSCSPRAALTDSPLRSQRHHVAGLVDSPVHSPRVLSQVY